LLYVINLQGADRQLKPLNVVGVLILNVMQFADNVRL